MSYQNGKQVFGKFSPDLDKKIAAANFTNARMKAILPAIGTIVRDINFQERVTMGVANPKTLTPDEIAERAKSFGNAFAAGLGDEDAKDKVIGDIVNQLVQLNANQREAEHAIYQLRTHQVKLWERLLPDLRAHSKEPTKSACLKLEHTMTTTGLVNVVRDQTLEICNVSPIDLIEVVVRIKSNVSGSPSGEDEKFLFIPSFSKRTRIVLPGNMYAKIKPSFDLHTQRFLPGKTKGRAAIDLPVLILVPVIKSPFVVSLWSKQLSCESTELNLESKPKVEAKMAKVQGGPGHVEAKIIHSFVE